MTEPDPIFGADLDRLKRLLTVGEEEARTDSERRVATTASLHSVTERVGGQIGRYRLLQVLGEGGMGMVYLAEQDQPIRRQVALKVVKPGMDSKRVIARFEAERQTLALLDHPNIAQVYDAGTTESGRPYFVMEHVKGLPVTEYCDRHKLSIDERLRLFQQMCLAVHHAHQKGIIHRDLKPSNILVSAEDDHPIPKIIDFGVAKAISQPLTERTLVTEDSHLLGTPEYMSPEQAEMVNEDIDTRSDIYSLGVLLYELLAGILPYDSETLRQGGIEHIRKTIRETHPKTPSTRLTKLGDEAAKLAESRRTEVDTLARRLRRELEWIPLKAMRKERSERYRSASELADDIENYLTGAPLVAGPLTAGYRLQKFLRRNKEVCAAAAVVAVVLVLGAIVSTWQAIRATQAKQAENRLRQQAEAQAYASDMSLAQQALAMNDLGRAWRLLESHRPTPGEVDLRNWEWRYLWQECRSDALGELCRYPLLANSVAYSPDGKVLAVAGYIQNFVEIWDVPGHKRIKALQPNEGHLVAFSPRGDLLATNAGKQIRLWQTGTWDLAGQLTLAGNVVFLKFSPDGTRLASLSTPDEATVWEVDRGAVVRQISGVRLLKGRVVGALDFSPDGKALVIGDNSHRLRVFDLASGNTDVNIPEAHPGPITAVAWSPNGSVIASGSGYSVDPIRLWEAASGKLLGELEGHTEWISQLIFSTDGLTLYSASADQTIRIWDVGQRRCLATLRGSRDEICGLALSPDGATLASAGKDGVVAFWDAHPRPEEEQPRLITLGRFGWPAFAPDGRILAAPRAGTVRLFDLATFEEIEQLPALGSDAMIVIYSPDATLLVSGSENGKTRVWSCAERRLLREFGDSNTPIFLDRFRADGRRLLATDGKGNGIWWDTRTWQAVQAFVAGPGQAAAVSPDGRLLAIGTATGALRWLNVETGELLRTTPGGHSWPPDRVAFSGDGTRVASTDADGTVALWDPSSFKLIGALKGHMKAACGVAFSPDGRRLATGGGGRQAVKLWDSSTLRELMTLSGQGYLFDFVAFSPDGRWLAACGWEGRLHLWRAPSWEEIEAAEKSPQSRQSP